MTDPTFEDSLAALERIVRDLEDGQLGLDEALVRYEQGIALIRSCQAELGQAEQRILALTGVDSDGQPTLQPFQHEATAKMASALPSENSEVPRRVKPTKKRTTEY